LQLSFDGKEDGFPDSKNSSIDVRDYLSGLPTFKEAVRNRENYVGYSQRNICQNYSVLSNARLFRKNKQANLKNKPKMGNLT